MRLVSRTIAVIAAFLALLAQPVLAQAAVSDSDPALVAEARRLTAQALAADAVIKARNQAERVRFSAAQAAYERAATEQRAAQAKYDADLATQQAKVAKYEADRAVWEARVKACQSGRYSQCEQR